MNLRLHVASVARLRQTASAWLRLSFAGQSLLACWVGGLLAYSLPLDQWLDRRHDLQATLLAPPRPADAALVVDVDEASVQRLGPWPLRRDAYVPSGQWLLANGARTVVFGILLVDSRDGDRAFASWLATAPAPVLLSARSVGGDGEVKPALAAPQGCLAQTWPAWQLPPWARADALSPRVPINRVGALSLPLDDDAVLRRWPLWQQAGSLTLPLLPLAAWMAVHPEAAAGLHCVGTGDDAAVVAPNGQRWPVDAEHRLQPWLHRAGSSPPPLALWTLNDAARGRLLPGQADALAQLVRGRVVFIGSSAALGDQVLSAQGPQSVTAMLAGTFDALSHNHVLTPPRLAVDLALLAAAWLPWWLGRRWHAKHPGQRVAAEWVGIAVAVLLVLLMDTALVAWGHQLNHVGWPLAMLAAAAVLALWRGARQNHAERLLLRQAHVEAEAANEVKSEFLAHMSHEIRTPLHALLGAAEVLSKTKLDASQSGYVAMFQSAGEDLLQILNDLLDLSKAEAGLLRPEREPFSLTRVVAAQVMLFEATAMRKQLGLRVDSEANLPDKVCGDANRLAQVLRNLLSNAIKFTSEGSVTLLVRHANDRSCLRFEVRDTGIGVPADQVSKLFSPYVQAGAKAVQRHGGTGLGLAISRRLTEAMGGRIGVHSRNGQGSNFYFELPLLAPPPPKGVDASRAVAQPGAGIAGLAPATGKRSASQPTTRPWRVLLADDNAQALLLVQAHLEGLFVAVDAADGSRSGGARLVRIDTVQDGAAALRRFEANGYDMVLMDLQMPVLDGRAAATAMRGHERQRTRPRAWLVALSGEADAARVASARAAGFDTHLAKPYSRAQLCAALGLAPAGQAGSHALHSTDDDSARSPLGLISQLPDSDLPDALDRLGSPVLYRQALNVAADPLLNFEQRLGQVLDSWPYDLAKAQRLAHDLRSIAATLGLAGLAADARELEVRVAETSPHVRPVDDPALSLARHAVVQRLVGVREVFRGQARGGLGAGQDPGRQTPAD